MEQLTIIYDKADTYVEADWEFTGELPDDGTIFGAGYCCDESVRQGGRFVNFEPIIEWKKEYDTDKSKFLKKVHLLHDAQVENWASGSNFKGVNTLDNYRFKEGDLRPSDFNQYVSTEKGEKYTPVRYPFHEENLRFLKSTFIKNPNDFELRATNPDFVEKKINDASEVGAEWILRNLIAPEQQKQGLDISDTFNTDLSVPTNPSEIDKLVNQPHELETAISELIDAHLRKNNGYTELAECVVDKATVNTYFCEVVQGRSTELRHVKPQEISWIGKAFFKKTSELTSIQRQYLVTEAEIIHNYPHLFRSQFISEKKTWWDAFKEKIYDKEYNRLAYSDWWYYAYGADSTLTYYNEFGSNFYNYDNRGIQLLLQRMYFRVLKYIEVDLKLGARYLTEKEVDLWSKGLLAEQETVLIVPTKNGKKGQTTYPQMEWWVSERIGHGTIAKCHPVYPHFENVSDEGTWEIPLQGQRLEEASTVTLSKVLQLRHNFIQKVYDSKMDLLLLKGISIDKASLNSRDYTDIPEVLDGLRKGNIVVGDSSNYDAKNNPTSQSHLKIIDTQAEIMLQSLDGLSLIIEDALRRLYGITPSALGQLGNRQSGTATQQAIEQTNQSLLYFYHEFYLWIKDVYQVMGNVLKHYYEGQQNVSIITEKGHKIIKKLKGLSLNHYQVFVRNGFQVTQEKNELKMKLSETLTRDSKYFHEIMSAYGAGTKDAIETKLIEALDRTKEQALQLEKSGQELEQARVQLEAQKVASPLEEQKLKSQTDITIKQMDIDAKAAEQQRELDFKGEQGDISFAQSRETELQKFQREQAMEDSKK